MFYIVTSRADSDEMPHFSVSELFVNIHLRPKLKFDFFPLTQQTLKKGPTKKKLLQFSVKNVSFFKFHCNLRELSNVNSVILANCLCI